MSILFTKDTLTFNEFYKIDINDIYLSVTKINSSLFKTTYEITLVIISMKIEYSINKRYNEFAGFYDILTFKYKNLNFPELPSKFQVFKKEKTRQKFFSKLKKLINNLV